MAGTPKSVGDALGRERADQAAERSGAGNLAEMLLGRPRVEALAGNQPEAGRGDGPER